jgi:hypothetical protein
MWEKIGQFFPYCVVRIAYCAGGIFSQRLPKFLRLVRHFDKLGAGRLTTGPLRTGNRDFLMGGLGDLGVKWGKIG